MGKWIEITVTVDGEGAEAVADVLSRYVYQGVAIERLFPGEVWNDEPLPPAPLVVKGYLPAESADTPEKQRKIEEALHYLSRLYPIPAPTFRTVEEEDWAEAWKRHYHPIRVGKRLLIKPAWMQVEVAPQDIVIEMDPGMAFGTGTHPTTQMCLEACEWFVRPGMRMVDLGTGSGILAIAGAKLGAARVLALDIDETAVRVAEENVQRNGVADRVTVLHGSLESLRTSARHFDFGTANLTAKIILELAPLGFQHAIYPAGKWVFSGIIREQAEEVIAALTASDLELLGQREMGDWVMLIMRRRFD